MLGVANRTRAQALAQHCCTNLAKRVQHHATSTNMAWKIWPFSNLVQQHPTCGNTSQPGGQTRATCCAQQCWYMLRWNAAIVWPGLYSLWFSSLYVCSSNGKVLNTFNDFIVSVSRVYSSLCCFIEQVALPLTTLLFLPKKVRLPAYKL